MYPVREPRWARGGNGFGGRGNWHRGSAIQRGRGRRNPDAPGDRPTTSDRGSIGRGGWRRTNDADSQGIRRPISYKSLEEMVNDDSVLPCDLANRLAPDSSGFYLRLKHDDNKAGMIQMLLKVFAKICGDDASSQSIITILQHALSTDFHLKVLSFIHGLHDEEKHKRGNVAQHISNCLCLMKAWLRIMPKTATKPVKMLKVIVEDAVCKLQLQKDLQIQNDMKEVQEVLDEKPQTKQQAKNDEKKAVVDAMAQLHLEQPPDNYRTISVFPQKNDVSTNEVPYFRSNLTSSAYQSADHYLDVQFRLLREDFIRPLREGIQDYHSLSKLPHMRRRVENVKIYQKVKIEFSTPGPKGMLYSIHFDPSPFKHIRWQNTKRLMYGNLICLSSDDFQNHLLFGTIADRDPEKLSFGRLLVDFVYSTKQKQIENKLQKDEDSSDEDADDPFQMEESDTDSDEEEFQIGARNFQVPDVDMQKVYTMVETEAYFEAYRHVLAGLQEITTIPLARYLLHCNKDVQPPAYFRTRPMGSNFNFNCILTSTNAYYESIDVLHPDKWPTAKQLGLDDSQKAALHDAVTKELSIIQGPPGTGKTYIGLVIMKLLLNNRPPKQRESVRRPGLQSHNPILVVCFTNHALDQFLEGISKFHSTGIVRVGGRCKTESLKQYTLLNVKRNSPHLNKFNGKTIWMLRNDLKVLQEQMRSNSEYLEVSTRSLLKLDAIRHVIPMHLYDQFSGQSSKPEKEAFLQWLGLENAQNHSKIEPNVIVQETVDAVMREITYLGFHPDVVLKAITATESLDTSQLINWIAENLWTSMFLPPHLDPRLVLHCLQQMNTGFNAKHLKKQGYSKVEINCAFLATGKFPDPNILLQWLISRTKSSATPTSGPGVPFEQFEITDMASKEMDKPNEGDEFVMKEEAELVQENRYLDSELDGFSLFKQRDNKGNKSRAKEIENKISALTFNAAEGAGFIDDEGFVMQRQEKRNQKLKLQKEIGKTEAMSEADAMRVRSIYDLDYKRRWSLYRKWVADFRAKLRSQINANSDKYCQLAMQLHEMQRNEDRRVLADADVIGITTTGAAKYRDIIYKLPVKVVIVEEAAEVLEAHIVTSMPRSTEHLILIGDHQQLKPSPTVFELARKFNLDVSLFERMIKNKAPFQRLNIQHRMRPRIADLLRLDIYDDLIDHEDVHKYGEISGVQHNVFFITHDVPEESVADGRSKSNTHEAEYLVALCQHLMHQGYRPDQITILAAYTGQLFAFKRIMRQRLHQGVRVTAVDNFQGEENDIILLSLVRSNAEANIGFLSIENRVCVALSRAKMGLYCIGNFTILEQKNRLWKNVVYSLKGKGQFGDALPLQCRNHPEWTTHAKTADDFKKVPEGGCGKPCEYRLTCGHVCTRTCHPDDQDHALYKCHKPCPKKCPEGHKCRRKCFQDCGPCDVQVEKMVPKCCHKQKMNCSQDPSTFVCKIPCPKVLSCGHKCSRTCGTSCNTSCYFPCKVQSPCGHEVTMPCCESQKPDMGQCKAKCNEKLSCGHYCKGTCSSCLQGRIHVRCQQRCDRVLICGHLCKQSCSVSCPPCVRKCATFCKHSKCKLECCQPCNACSEICDWKCEHLKCEKLCGEPCDRPPCNVPCKQKLKCGHPCIGLCGEICPKLCRVCDKDKVTEIFFGDEDESDARFVQLEDCGHIFTYEGLDRWMNQVDDGDEGIKNKECPRCKTVVRKSKRYRRIVNQQFQMVNEVKAKIAGRQKEIEAERRELLKSINECKDILAQSPIMILAQEAHKDKAKTLTALEVVKVKFENLKAIWKATRSVKKEMVRFCSQRYKTSLMFPPRAEAYYKKECPDYEKAYKKLSDWIMTPRHNFSDQEIEDLQREVERLKSAAQLCIVEVALKEKSMSSSLAKEMRKLIFEDFAPFDEEKSKKFADFIKDLKQQEPDLFNGLGIRKVEREMILKAMNFGMGHWYKCPNGHIYSIGDCGGATVESKCPECRETIGGTGHRLATGNRLASEMDGAARPAYDAMNFHIPEE